MTKAERELLEQVAASLAGHMLGQGNPGGTSVADAILEKLAALNRDVARDVAESQCPCLTGCDNPGCDKD